ncbi:VacJ family lipoprotein [Novosphingobium flavum]|uniref:VacJ family lipoprotein n=1 Tax=Novosphingobium flavum TaxID=1778672 RepID=A0A7X1FUA2_9SPHN|nr:VacJ family lipoprotein [Novosphingobium flavum]MBC2666472.1 VacJ family lipoprotein [Novosphingobium flavum]
MSALSLAFLIMAAAPAEATAPVQPDAAAPTAVAAAPAPEADKLPSDSAPADSVPAAPAPASVAQAVPPVPVGNDPAVPAPPAGPATAPIVATVPASDPAAAPPPVDDQVDIVVTARAKSPTDPFARINVESFKAIQAVDQAVVGPVAMGYKKTVPKPVRDGLRNFLRNLEEPVSFVNYVLQLKPGRAAKSLGRFTLNTTVGVAGLIDVAKRKPFNLPYKPNGFGNTLACYGVGNGPYFFLPLVGPITLRDLVGLTLDKGFIPAVAGKPFNKSYYAIPTGIIDSLNDRIEIDGQLNRLREESPDPYVAMRELYMKQRLAEIAEICPKRVKQPIDDDLPPRVGKGKD